MKGNNIICSECGAVLTEEVAQYFHDRIFCEDCFERLTVVCDCCQERIWRVNAEQEDTLVLCQDCYDECYSRCEGCSRLIHTENDSFYEEGSDYPYCRDCYERRNAKAIKSYYYKPEPIFYGSGPLFFGVEIEVDKGGEDDDNAQELLDIANKNSCRIYCKHDGSLDDGFEIVSHPMSLDYHTNSMNWADIFSSAIDMGYRSHNTHTCGLHVHVSRSAFGETYDEQEKAIGRVVYFVEKHWNELVIFSRRNPINLSRWAAKYATISDTTAETYNKAKNKRLGRYVAINLENCNSIEIRIFKGTLRYKTFLATLQLVDEICKCAINMTDMEIEGMSWLDFVQRISPKKAELIEYLKEKRLYVNEPLLQEGVEE